MKEECILSLLPGKLRIQMQKIVKDYEKLQEIKVRIEKPVFYFQDGREYMLKDEWGRPYIATKEEVRELLEYVSHYSLYAYEEEMRQGFLTVEGGHRIGCRTGDFRRRACEESKIYFVRKYPDSP